jgi:hypothetical protein
LGTIVAVIGVESPKVRVEVPAVIERVLSSFPATAIVNDCETSGAVSHTSSPDWLAITVQVPSALARIVIVVPETVHLLGVPDLKLTGRLDVALDPTIATVCSEVEAALLERELKVID